MTDWTWHESTSAWLGSYQPEDTTLSVAGSLERPDEILRSAALSLIQNAMRLKESIADFLSGTPVEVHSKHGVSVVVHPDRPAVAAMQIVQIEFRDPTQPNTAHVLVVTEYPDPYYLYDLTVEGILIVRATGRFW
jgi:hypothetical protein